MRRLSVSRVKNPTRDASHTTTPKHQYFGQEWGRKVVCICVRLSQGHDLEVLRAGRQGRDGGPRQDALKGATEKVVPADQAYEIA